MATLVFFFVLWMVCKGIKALFRPRQRKAPAPAPAVSRVSRSLAALEALQQQRDLLESMIADYQYQLEHGQLSSVQFEKTQNQIVSAYGRLASVEQRISKMCA